MRSPFPGMDPYLENPAHWPDFHNRFGNSISTQLNHRLPDPYFAQLEIRTELGWVTIEDPAPPVPDVAVVKMESGRRTGRPAGGVELKEARNVATPGSRVILEGTDVVSVAIRTRHSRKSVVTWIEILSPSNKRRGKDRDDYVEKQRDLMASGTSIVEIDLLRRGMRSDFERLMQELPTWSPEPAYRVYISRSWQRSSSTVAVEGYAINQFDPLPCIPLPLRERDRPELPLDLQFALDQLYDGAPYSRSLRYEKPLDHLSGDEQRQCREYVSEWRDEFFRPAEPHAN